MPAGNQLRPGYVRMNIVIIKYCLLIGAILASTAVVAGPLNPRTMFNTIKLNGENEEIKIDPEFYVATFNSTGK